MFEKVCRSVFAGVLILFFTLNTYGQCRLEGKIIDHKSKEPLAGATILLDSTQFAGIAGIDGGYSIDKVPPGHYNVTVRFVSFQTIHEKVVVASGQKSLLCNFEMESADIELTGVQVVGTRRTNTDLSMLSNTRQAQLVVNGVSSQQIARSLDRDAGEVVRRVPGVTIMDSRFVVVRGLNQRYNNVWLNESSTPSSEADSRAFSFDVIPGGLIDNLLVYKTPAPELPADFSGGFVKVFTKSIPEKNSTHLSVQLAGQEGSVFKDFSGASQTALDWLGFGSSSRGLPADFPSHLSSSLTQTQLAGYTSQINKGWNTQHSTALPDLRASLVLNRIFTLAGKKAASITAVSYSNTFRTYSMSNKRYGIYQQAIDQPFARNDYQDNQFVQEAKLGLLENLSLELSPLHKLEFRNFFNQTGRNRFTNRAGVDRNNDYTIRETERYCMSRSTYSGQFSGKHRSEDGETKVDWVAGYSYANRNEPDRTIVTSRLNTDSSSPYAGKYGTDGNDVKRNFQKLNEHVVTFNLQAEKDLFLGEAASRLKAGLYSEYKFRDFNARNFIYQFRSDLLPEGFVYQSYQDMFSANNLSTNGITLKENTNKSDSYQAMSLNSAGYLGMQSTLSDKLDCYAGVRMERNQLNLDGYESDGTAPVSVKRSEMKLFPSLNLTWHLTEKQQLRLAGGTSINRPEFREIAPYVFYDFEHFANFEGNPSLKAAHISNLDLRYEFYPTPSETFTLALFGKLFDNPIETSYYEVGGQQQYTYKNARQARNIGLEMDLRKNLVSIGLPDLTLVMNASLINSRVLFSKGDFERNRAMQGQSPWLLNAGLYYDKAETGWKGSLLYNSIGKRIVFVGVVNQNINEDIPDIYEATRHVLDFSIGKKLNERFDVNLGVRDLLNQPVEFVQFPKFTDADGKTQKRKQVTRSFHPGRNLSLALTMRF